MSQDTFLSYRDACWVWISALLVAASTILYVWHTPIGEKNGGTTFGLTIGTVAAAAMVFLMLYAKRKRAYHSTMGTLKAWLSAHVWIGSALLILVPIHSGFQFGYNIHTLCYLFIVVTILTGIWGVFLCIKVPPDLQARREGLSLKGLLSEVNALSTDIGTLARNKSKSFLQLVNQIDFSPPDSLIKILFASQELLAPLDEQPVSRAFDKIPHEEQDDALKLVGIVEKKIELLNKFYRELRGYILLKIWLYIHLPFAVGAFTLLVIHIFSVFYLH